MQFLLLVLIAFLTSFITVQCVVIINPTHTVTTTTHAVTTTTTCIFNHTTNNLYYCQNTSSCPLHSACTGCIPNNTAWAFVNVFPDTSHLRTKHSAIML